MLRTNTENTEITEQLWFEPSVNKVFGVQRNGEINKDLEGPENRLVPDIVKFSNDNNYPLESLEKSWDRNKKSGIEVNDVYEKMLLEKKRLICGDRSIVEEKDFDNAIDYFILSGAHDIARPAVLSKKGYVRGGHAGDVKLSTIDLEFIQSLDK